MQEKVRNYLNRVAEAEEKELWMLKKAEREREDRQKAKEEQQKRKLLMKLDLTEREYRTDGSDTYDPDYPLIDEEQHAYYRIVPIEVTDEEWKAIKSAHAREQALSPQRGIRISIEDDDSEPNGNGTSETLKTIAVAFYIVTAIGGVVLGVILKSVVYWLSAWAAGFIAGTVMLGFSEIVRLLANMERRTQK